MVRIEIECSSLSRLIGAIKLVVDSTGRVGALTPAPNREPCGAASTDAPACGSAPVANASPNVNGPFSSTAASTSAFAALAAGANVASSPGSTSVGGRVWPHQRAWLRRLLPWLRFLPPARHLQRRCWHRAGFVERQQMIACWHPREPKGCTEKAGSQDGRPWHPAHTPSHARPADSQHGKQLAKVRSHPTRVWHVANTNVAQVNVL